jgi:hypothetical protein
MLYKLMQSNLYSIAHNIMESSEDIDFKYYDKKIEELEKLLSQAKSQTLIDLITRAKTNTEKSLEKLLQLQKGTVIYLTACNIKNKNRIQKIQEHLDLCNNNVNELKDLIIPDELRQTLNEFYTNHFTDLEESIKVEANVSDLTLKTFTLCAKEFEKVLLQLIVKPTTSTFHYETIIDILNYIATKLIPGLEELKMASNFPVKIRRKQFAKNGDKILIYLEQYIDVLEKWETLGNAYIKILDD